MTSIAIPAPVKTAPSVLGCDRFLLAGEATNQKKGHGCVKIDTPWPFSILILRDARAPKRRAILKPFCDAIWGPSQASNPRQSRESQPFVRLPPLYSPFSSIVTPYICISSLENSRYHKRRKRAPPKRRGPLPSYFISGGVIYSDRSCRPERGVLSGRGGSVTPSMPGRASCTSVGGSSPSPTRGMARLSRTVSLQARP